MKFLRKHVGQQGTVVSYVDLPLIFVHLGSMGNLLIPEAEKHALRPFYLLNLKVGM